MSISSWGRESNRFDFTSGSTEALRQPRAASTSTITARGWLPDQRLYQLVRQPGMVGEHTFEITFLEPGIEAYVLTFG
jgi:hypothetical protein